MPVAYLGPEGTFCEAALRAVDPDAEPLSCPTIPAALAAVRGGTAERAVVPIESSVEGVVTATLDDLAAGGDLVIVAEVQIPVAFALLARPAPRSVTSRRSAAIRTPCRSAALDGREPAGRRVRPGRSNAEAARQAADEQLDAALAGAFAAERYGLAVLVPDVHDRANAVTRFVVVSGHGPLPARTGTDRTSVAAFLADDHPGALLEILTEFAVRGINLTTIQSRPTGDRLGHYYFFIDCEGHVDDARVGEALMGLRRVCARRPLPGQLRALRRRCDPGTAGHLRRRVRRGRGLARAAALRPPLGLVCAGPDGTRPGPFGTNGLTGTGPSRAAAAVPGPAAPSPAAAPGASAPAAPGRHLLGEQRGLDAVEQALQPADQLSLRDPQLGLARHLVLGERQRQPLQLVDQLRGQAVLEFLDRALVDLLQPGPALLVQRRRPDLLQQLPDHAADPHDLGRLLHHLRDRALVLAARPPAGHPIIGHAVGADHEDLRMLVRSHGSAHSLVCPFRLRTSIRVRASRVTRRSRILPTCSLASITRCASAACDIGSARSTTAADLPGADQRPDVLADGRPRWPPSRRRAGRAGAVACTLARLASSSADVELGPGAALQPDDGQPAADGQRGDVAGQVARAHDVEDDVGAAAAGGS